MSTSMHEGPSWLTLERYVLGELPESARAEVEQQLASSERARAMLSAIQADDSALPALPSAPAASPAASASPARLPRRRSRRAVWWTGISTGLAAAASLLLWVRAVPDAELPAQQLVSARPYGPASKGGVIAISLFSELTGSEPRSFGEGERFKVLFTCPPELREPARVLVFQGGARYEPLVRLAAPSCGNLQPWPGAFTLSGKQPAQVCVAWGERASHASSAAQLAEHAVCTELTPAR